VRALSFAGALLVAAGAALVGHGLWTGQLQVSLFVVFPVVHGASATGGLGMLALFAGFVLWMLGRVGLVPPPQAPGDMRDPAPSPRVRGGGVVFLGPIPIVVGTDLRWAVLAFALAVLAFVLALAWWLLLLRGTP